MQVGKECEQALTYPSPPLPSSRPSSPGVFVFRGGGGGGSGGAEGEKTGQAFLN